MGSPAAAPAVAGGGGALANAVDGPTGPGLSGDGAGGGNGGPGGGTGGGNLTSNVFGNYGGDGGAPGAGGGGGLGLLNYGNGTDGLSP